MLHIASDHLREALDATIILYSTHRASARDGERDRESCDFYKERAILWSSLHPEQNNISDQTALLNDDHIISPLSSDSLLSHAFREA